MRDVNSCNGHVQEAESTNPSLKNSCMLLEKLSHKQCKLLNYLWSRCAVQPEVVNSAEVIRVIIFLFVYQLGCNSEHVVIKNWLTSLLDGWESSFEGITTLSYHEVCYGHVSVLW